MLRKGWQVIAVDKAKESAILAKNFAKQHNALDRLQVLTVRFEELDFNSLPQADWVYGFRSLFYFPPATFEVF